MKIVLNWLMLIVVVFIKWNISNEYLLPRLEEKHWTSRAAFCWPQKLINYVFIYLIKLEMTIQSQGVCHCLATLAVAMFVTVQVYILWLVSTSTLIILQKHLLLLCFPPLLPPLPLLALLLIKQIYSQIQSLWMQQFVEKLANIANIFMRSRFSKKFRLHLIIIYYRITFLKLFIVQHLEEVFFELWFIIILSNFSPKPQ